MIMLPSLLTILPTPLHCKLDLNLGPETLHALSLIPWTDIKAHRPVSLAISSGQGSEDRRHRLRCCADGCPVSHAAVGVGCCAEGGVGGCRWVQEGQGYWQVCRWCSGQCVEAMAGDGVAGCHFWLFGGVGGGGGFGLRVWGWGDLLLVEGEAVGYATEIGGRRGRVHSEGLEGLEDLNGKEEEEYISIWLRFGGYRWVRRVPCSYLLASPDLCGNLSASVCFLLVEIESTLY